MSLRYGETEHFPEGWTRGKYAIVVYFEYAIVVYFEEGQLKEKQYQYVEEVKRFLDDCKALVARGIPFKVYGVWHGTHNTDIFVLEWEKTKPK